MMGAEDRLLRVHRGGQQEGATAFKGKTGVRAIGMEVELTGFRRRPAVSHPRHLGVQSPDELQNILNESLLSVKIFKPLSCHTVG